MTITATLPATGAGRDAVHVALSTVAANLLSFALPVMTLQLYDRILPNPESGTLSLLMAGVVTAIILETCLKLARDRMIGWNGAAWEYAAASRAMRHLLAADMPGQTGQSGENLNNLSAIGRMRDFHSGYTLSTSVDLLFVPVYGAFIVYIAGPLAAVPLLFLAAFAAVSLAQGLMLRRRLEAREKADDRRYDFLIEALDAMPSVKAFALENIMGRRYEALQEDSVNANHAAAEATASVFNAGSVMAHALAAATITAGALLVLNGMTTTGALIATLLLAGRMMQAVQRGLSLWVRYQDYRVSSTRVASIFAAPARAEPDAPQTPAQGLLSLRNLAFSFGRDPLLHGLSLDLKPGEALAVCGPDGAGKSTLLSLMAGVYPASAGKIGIDGVDILRYAAPALSRHVGLITPEPVIFRGTIRDNITRFGEIGEKEARGIAAKLGLDRDVASLPAGFDTVLYGNSSDAVPPGLKQRIAITRVLASAPRIVLFDAADRSLDREGKRLVLKLLAELRETCAIVLVTEDPDIAQLATRKLTLSRPALKGAAA